MCSFNHDHNPSPVAYGARLKKEIKTRYAGMTIIIPAGAYAYINKTVEFDEYLNNFCHFCISFAQNTFIPPKSMREWFMKMTLKC